MTEEELMSYFVGGLAYDMMPEDVESVGADIRERFQ
jgi:hypothetical protein